MEFSSITFIWVFLPILLILYYLLAFWHDPEKRLVAQNTLLLLASMFFYAFGGINYLFLLLILILLNYCSGRYIGKAESKQKLIFISTIILDVSVLVFFKYSESFLNFITDFSMFVNPDSFIDFTQFPRIIMPLALSFVVFQLISYLTDIYNRKISAETNFINFAIYITFFAQLVQGPIMRYSELGNQIACRTHSCNNFALGIKRFVLGFAKKIILANRFAAVANPIWTMESAQISFSEAWLGIIAYTLQIYFDFSAYSDMAIGVGKMFGFEITENFNNPYFALSIREFWKRWHMSLSTWFKDYIYIPLGGSRLGLKRTCENLFIVFLVTGIWHGSNITFICWGLLFAVVSILEHIFLGKILDKNPVKIINWVYTMFVVIIGWVFFRAPDMNYACNYLYALFHYSGAEDSILGYLNPEAFLAFVIAILSAPIYAFLKNKKLPYCGQVIESIFVIFLFLLSMMLLISGSYQPSVYWAF